MKSWCHNCRTYAEHRKRDQPDEYGSNDDICLNCEWRERAAIRLTPEQRAEQQAIRAGLEASGEYTSISTPRDPDAIQGEGDEAAYLFYVKTPTQTHSQILLQQPNRRKP